MNPFLNFERRFQPPKSPRRLYAQVDKIEPIAGRGSYNVRLDGVDADWFDGPSTQGLVEDEFFASTPLAAVELEFLEQQANDVLGVSWDDIVEGGTGPWFTVELAPPSSGFPAMIYTNVFSEGQKTTAKVPLAKAPAKSDEQLRRRFALQHPNAKERDLRQALQGASAASDGLVVYDIGQGNCNAVVDGAGRPLLYFDFGSPFNSHMHTWSGLKLFCLCQNPTIVLSHWDLDHFLSANIDTRAQKQPWIVPRQPLGATHRTFANQLKKNNRLLIWKKGSPPLSVGPITILECNGARTNFNDSGLAVIAEGMDGARTTHRALLPGDARYTAIPGYSTHSFSSVVSPHHGAKMNSGWTPTCPGLAQSRLVHSFGHPNQWGHADPITRQRHDSTGWIDPSIRPAAVPYLVRETANRTGGYGHVFVPWDASTRIPAVTCCGSGSLTPTQT